MGEIKSKTVHDLNGFETWRIQEQQQNVDKLIKRMNMKIEEPELSNSKSQPITELRRKLSFKKKVKKKKEDSSEFNNNNLNTINKVNIIIDQVPMKSCELECCEIVKEMGPRELDDVDNVNVTINKKDSIDNIIDMIVSKSIKRDETLIKINQDTNKKKVLKRSRSYHGKEKKKKLIMYGNIDGDYEEESLMKRLENLEKRAMIFEKGVGRVEEWLRGSKFNRQRSRCSAASEEFEKNMREVLEENYKDEEELLNELKTIERVKPFQIVPKKDKLIAVPKADPIIRNSIEKIVYKEWKPNGWKIYSSNLKNSKESLLNKGWVVVENKTPRVGNGAVCDGNVKSEETLVKSKCVSNNEVISNGINGINGDVGNGKEMPRVSGKLATGGIVWEGVVKPGCVPNYQ